MDHADIDHSGLTGVGDLSAHTGDTSDAHDASAISVLDTATNFTGTDVEAVLAELQDNIDAVGGGGIASGTSFPGGPSTDDLFHRTNLTEAIWRFDGTRWRCGVPHPIVMNPWTITLGTGVTATQQGSYRCGTPALLGGSDIWLVSSTIKFYINGGTALSGSHKWVGLFAKADSAGAQTTVATHTIDSGASSAFRIDTVAIGALLGSGYFIFTDDWTKTGTPGNLIYWHEFDFEHVAT